MHLKTLNSYSKQFVVQRFVQAEEETYSCSSGFPAPGSELQVESSDQRKVVSHYSAISHPDP